MSKYIPAEKLIVEIERRRLSNRYIDTEGYEAELLEIIASLQQGQPMPDSTQLIEWWHEDKEMLKEKDFRDDPWRLAYNAFMCGFGRGIAVKKQKQPEVQDGKFVFPKYLYARTKDNKTIDMSYAPQDMTAVEYVRNDFVEQEQPETDMKSPFTGGKVAILSREEEVTFRGEKVKITRKYYRCVDTGREFTDSKLDDEMMWAVFRAYCEKKGIISFTDIMLKQVQPEVDLEKEIAEWQGYEAFPEGTNITPLPKAMNIVEKTAKHFYELGLNARKENIVI